MRIDVYESRVWEVGAVQPVTKVHWRAILPNTGKVIAQDAEGCVDLAEAFHEVYLLMQASHEPSTQVFFVSAISQVEVSLATAKSLCAPRVEDKTAVDLESTTELLTEPLELRDWAPFEEMSY